MFAMFCSTFVSTEVNPFCNVVTVVLIEAIELFADVAPFSAVLAVFTAELSAVLNSAKRAGVSNPALAVDAAGIVMFSGTSLPSSSLFFIEMMKVLSEA